MKTIIVLLPIIIVAFLVTGCGQKVAEKATEKAIEASSGGATDVDIDKNSITINTDEGSFQTGEKVSLPSGFPEDVYVIDGTIISSLTTAGGYSVTITTDQSQAKVKEIYKNKLQAQGWDITSTMDVSESTIISADKDNRTTTVSITKSDDKTNVAITTVSGE